MKRIALVFLVIMVMLGVKYAYRLTDWRCVINCQKNNYNYDYCVSICTYEYGY